MLAWQTASSLTVHQVQMFPPYTRLLPTMLGPRLE